MQEFTQKEKMLVLSQDAPWEKLPAESDSQYERFFSYMLLGPMRSIPQLVQHLGLSPHSASTLYGLSKKFAWKQRAQAWDNLQHERELAAVSESRIQNKTRRVQFLEKLMNKIEDKIETDLELDFIKWQDIAPIAKNILEQMRIEYEQTDGTHPANQQEVSFTLNISKPRQTNNDEDEEFEFGNIIDVG